MVTITVDDNAIQDEEGVSMLKACLDNGIYIPNLCYMEGFEAAASCRMCFVAIEGEDKPVAACTLPVKASLRVRTDTASVRQLQRTALQLLLSVHHVDCKNCPANKKCALQDLAKFLSVRLKPKHLEVSLKEPEIDTSHPCLDYYPNRCVLCGKCIRICRSHSGQSEITFARRGYDTVISFFGAPDLADNSCTDCNRCVDVCPVGALVMKAS